MTIVRCVVFTRDDVAAQVTHIHSWTGLAETYEGNMGYPLNVAVGNYLSNNNINPEDVYGITEVGDSILLYLRVRK